MTNDSVVTGSATYRQRMALPPGAVLRVRLEDVSRQDAAAEIVAECEVPTEGLQVPLPFRLEYDPARIVESHRYNVRASLHLDDRLLFTTDTAHPVITGGAPTDVMVVMIQVPARDPEPSEPSPAELVNTYWKLLEVDGQPAVVADNRREAHLILQLDDHRLVGSTGCNRLVGSYQLDGEQLTFSPAGTTMMMCPEELMRQERLVTAALTATRSWRITGQVLELLDGAQVLARLEARHL